MLSDPDEFYDSISPAIIHAIRMYVIYGRKPGDFLSAVISNDLKEACGRADYQNKRNLHNIVAYLYNETPATCWGSIKNMNDWIKNRGSRELESIHGSLVRESNDDHLG